MPFFGNTYTLRRYGEDQIIDGYPTAGYEDIQVVLDVQTMSDDEVIEAGGSRDEQMLKTSRGKITVLVFSLIIVTCIIMRPRQVYLMDLRLFCEMLCHSEKKS